MKRVFRLFLLAIGLFSLGGQGALAGGQPVVRVGKVSTTQSCEYFREYEGSRIVAADEDYRRSWGSAQYRSSYASFASWRSWIVKDCKENFQTLRASVEAALASSGHLLVGPGGYVLDISISDIAQTPPANSRPVYGENDYYLSDGSALVTLSVTLRDASGRGVHGAVLTKRVKMSQYMATQDLRVRTAEPGEAAYDLLQQEVSLAVARTVAFKLDPLMVTGKDGNEIALNYGAPLLEMGAVILAEKSSGIGSVRYTVTSAGPNGAVAEVDGDNDSSAIAPGNPASLIEKDDPAANGRRYKRVPLP